MQICGRLWKKEEHKIEGSGFKKRESTQAAEGTEETGKIAAESRVEREKSAAAARG